MTEFLVGLGIKPETPGRPIPGVSFLGLRAGPLIRLIGHFAFLLLCVGIFAHPGPVTTSQPTQGRRTIISSRCKATTSCIVRGGVGKALRTTDTSKSQRRDKIERASAPVVVMKGFPRRRASPESMHAFRRRTRMEGACDRQGVGPPHAPHARYAARGCAWVRSAFGPLTRSDVEARPRSRWSLAAARPPRPSLRPTIRETLTG